MPSAEEFSQHYLEDLISFFGLNTKVTASVDEHTIELNVPSTSLNGFLIGSGGENLRSIQHLTNMALRSGGYKDKVAVVDIAGYRRQQNERLARQAQELATQVKTSGEPYTFEALSAYERRVVHQAVAEVSGVVTESTGEGYERRLSIKPESVSTS